MACLPKNAIMPTIKARKQANGATRHAAIVRMRRYSYQAAVNPPADRALIQRQARAGEFGGEHPWLLIMRAPG